MSLCAVCVCCCWPVFKQERFHFRFQTFYVQFWESEERKLVRVIHWYITPRETNKYIRMGNFPSRKRSPGLDGDTVWCPAIADGIIMGSKRKDKKHRRGKKKSLQWDIVTRVPLYYRYIEMSEKRILFSSKPRVLFVAVVTVRNHAAGLSVDPADATTVTEEYKSIYIYCICLYVGRRRRRRRKKECLLGFQRCVPLGYDPSWAVGFPPEGGVEQHTWMPFSFLLLVSRHSSHLSLVPSFFFINCPGGK